MRFGLTGAAGFVAPRHMRAIKETGHELVAALDPHDAVGVIDSYAPKAHFFTQPELFDRHLEKQRNKGSGIDYLSVCSPNWLHDAHIRLGMRLGANVICEKPLVIHPRNLDELALEEERYGKRVFCILQLREHDLVQGLRKTVKTLAPLWSGREKVSLQYITRRGSWYDYSWKGDEAKSGGLAMNLGVHFFDLLLWLFGECVGSEVTLNQDRRMRGNLQLENADVEWFLSVNEQDLPEGHKGHAYRKLVIGGQPVDLSLGFDDLHTLSYRSILAGRGYGIEDARPAIELVHRIRTAHS